MDVILPFRLEADDDSEVSPWYFRAVSYELHGLARLEEGRLVLQWSGTSEVTEIKGTATRVREEPLPVRRVVLPVTQIASVALEGGWWRPRVVLRVADLGVLSDIPGAARGALALRIARSDRALARDLITGIEILAADAALAAAESPPPLPPDAL